jgi:hypothetical protein
VTAGQLKLHTGSAVMVTTAPAPGGTGGSEAAGAPGDPPTPEKP